MAVLHHQTNTNNQDSTYELILELKGHSSSVIKQYRLLCNKNRSRVVVAHLMVPQYCLVLLTIL